jgi:hypothetical protein
MMKRTKLKRTAEFFLGGEWDEGKTRAFARNFRAKVSKFQFANFKSYTTYFETRQ